ncbi:MAG: Mur ligase family protein [Limosilactobacillus sp.]|uniref:Mur ligase family protein n=1 Tax=Limosilactobacillus sp. TaxID=2773925 RepID=UPI0027001469|nr:Mur ligase family protein [Limosilactobacillus sp.]
MSIRSSVAGTLGRSSYWFLHRFFKGGSSLPGKLALAIDPEILKSFSKKYDLVIVTGTNGKTLTTALSVRVMQRKFDHVLTNPTGSNMEQGIVTTMITAPRPNKKGLAVLEVDEANVVKVAKYIKPVAFVFTNIFRDQMDRYGEIYTTYKKILDGVRLAPEATIIANGDSQLFNTEDLPNPIVYYGFDHEHLPAFDAPANTDGLLCPKCQHILKYHMRTYAGLGDYFCPNCGFHRPELTHAVTKIVEQTPTSSTFEIDGHEFTIGVGGTYNIYNALAAYSLGRHFDIAPEDIKKAFENDERVFGRQEVIDIDGKQVTMILVKNPVGLNQVLDMIATDKEPFSLGFLLNANYADGIDTSWIWDGDFEQFTHNDVRQYFTGGERYKDISTRLTMAGIDDLWEEPSLEKVVEKIKDLPTKRVYLLATYTAVLQVRKLLAEKNYIKGGMD